MLLEAGQRKETVVLIFPHIQYLHFDVFRGSLGNSILGNSSSAVNNTRSRLPSRLFFRFLWLCCYLKYADKEYRTEL